MNKQAENEERLYSIHIATGLSLIIITAILFYFTNISEWILISFNTMGWILMIMGLIYLSKLKKEGQIEDERTIELRKKAAVIAFICTFIFVLLMASVSFIFTIVINAIVPLFFIMMFMMISYSIILFIIKRR
ncbi:hypothetical protein KY345_00265 [Candidatus Woesearchaeota archaeon]|nr:hypothetical protein [Candidatus Woesearchaeota archaeon]